jgi:hypothetical protein
MSRAYDRHVDWPPHFRLKAATIHPMLRIVHSSASTICILIQGLGDAALVAETKRLVKSVFDAVPGDWTVALVAADTRARWDVAVRGPNGIHVFSFPGAAAQVPELLSQYLSRTLPRMLSPATP